MLIIDMELFSGLESISNDEEKREIQYEKIKIHYDDSFRSGAGGRALVYLS